MSYSPGRRVHLLLGLGFLVGLGFRAELDVNQSELRIDMHWLPGFGALQLLEMFPGKWVYTYSTVLKEWCPRYAMRSKIVDELLLPQDFLNVLSHTSHIVRKTGM